MAVSIYTIQDLNVALPTAALFQGNGRYPVAVDARYGRGAVTFVSANHYNPD